MATYDQRAGKMHLSFNRANDFSSVVDFDGMTLTGYTVSAMVVSLVSGSTVQAMSASVTDAALGKCNVSLTDTQTGSLAAGTYGWQLDWVAPGSVQRTALKGTMEVEA